MCDLDNTLLKVNNWRDSHLDKIEGLTEFLVGEVFQSYEGVKKDNMTLLAVDLSILFHKFKSLHRKNSFEEKVFSNMSMTSSGFISPERAKKMFSIQE